MGVNSNDGVETILSRPSIVMLILIMIVFNAVMWVRQFSRNRGRGSIDETGPRRGRGKAVRNPCKCIKLNS